MKDKLSIKAPSITCFGLVTCRGKVWQLKPGCPLRRLFEVTSLEKYSYKYKKLKLKLWAVEKLKNQSSKSMRARGRKFGVKTGPQIFLAQNLIFFNGSTAYRFLQRLSNFPQWLSTFQEIRENLSMAASIWKIAIQALYFSKNRDIPG
jgi:hypothetical protein